MSTTYPLLIADVYEYLNRNDSRLDAQLPRLISLAEERITLDVSTADQSITVGAIVVTNGSFTAGDEVYEKPERWRQTIDFNFDSGATDEHRTHLLERSYAFCRQFAPNPAATGVPRYFADYDDSHFLVAATPADDYPFELIFFERVDPLSESNQTNWIAETYPQALLYATLLEAQPFLKRDERVQLWNTAYSDVIQKIVLEQKMRVQRMR